MDDHKLMKQTREKLGLTQKEMAQEMGFTGPEYISRIEHGKKNLSRTARKLLHLLGQGHTSTDHTSTE